MPISRPLTPYYSPISRTIRKHRCIAHPDSPCTIKRKCIYQPSQPQPKRQKHCPTRTPSPYSRYDSRPVSPHYQPPATPERQQGTSNSPPIIHRPATPGLNVLNTPFLGQYKPPPPQQETNATKWTSWKGCEHPQGPEDDGGRQGSWYGCFCPAPGRQPPRRQQDTEPEPEPQPQPEPEPQPQPEPEPQPQPEPEPEPEPLEVESEGSVAIKMEEDSDDLIDVYEVAEWPEEDEEVPGAPIGEPVIEDEEKFMAGEWEESGEDEEDEEDDDPYDGDDESSESDEERKKDDKGLDNRH